MTEPGDQILKLYRQQLEVPVKAHGDLILPQFQLDGYLFHRWTERRCFRFLDLPAEMRDEVYRQTVLLSPQTVKYPVQYRYSQYTVGSAGPWMPKTSMLRHCSRKANRYGFLFVCRLVSQEYLRVCQKMLIFRFNIDFVNAHAKPLWPAPPSLWTHLRTFELKVIFAKLAHESRVNWGTMMKQLRRTIQKFGSVREFNMTAVCRTVKQMKKLSGGNKWDLEFILTEMKTMERFRIEMGRIADGHNTYKEEGVKAKDGDWEVVEYVLTQES